MFPVTHVSFPNRRLAASACGRFAERRGNPDFKDRVFTWDDLKAWELERYGAFRYLDYWEGFTLEGKDLRPFRDGGFDPLTVEERMFLGLLPDVPDDGLIIVTSDGDHPTLAHEIVHVLYAQDADYHAEVETLFAGARLPRLQKALHAMGYEPAAYANEGNAYLATGLEPEMRGWREFLMGQKVRRLLMRRFGWNPQEPPPAGLRGRIREIAYPARA